MTKLCVAIYADEVEQVRREVAAAAEAGADLVELRVDHLTDAEQVRQLIRAATLPVIVTCRPTWEGGNCTLPETDRLALLASAAHDAAYVDVELKALPGIAAFSREPREQRGGIICSSHDFAGRPDRLYKIVSELNAAPIDVAKIVWTARTLRDNLEAFEILLTRQKPTIALCMGEAGLISRILAKKFGAFLTFASLKKDGGTAPGQVPVEEMKRLYRWDAIGRDTRVYGVVAQPVMHSMSPAIHNAAFDAIHYDGVYLPLLVEGSYESFKAFMETFIGFEALNLSGLSITLPHKENALRYLTEKGARVEELARSIGAVNTIAIQRPAGGGACELYGFNTDYAAILDSITARLSIRREDLADYRVAVIGAGGTGRTAVAALAHYGATVVVYNRTLERAEALAAEFNGQRGKVVAAPMEKLGDSCCQIYLNTTSVGMYPNVDDTPFGGAAPKLGADSLVFDTIYNPIQTKLLREAEARGAKTISGVEMFVRQAVGQFEAWTRQPAPMDVMRKVLESRLRRS